jgi:precorrin-6B methylase 2
MYNARGVWKHLSFSFDEVCMAERRANKIIINVMVTGGRAFACTLGRTDAGRTACSLVREVKPNALDLAAALTALPQAEPAQREAPKSKTAPGNDPRLATAGFQSWEDFARHGAFYLVYPDEKAVHLDVSQHLQAQRRRGTKAYVLMDKTRSRTLPIGTPPAEIARVILEDAQQRPEVWQTPPAAASERVRPWPDFAYRGMMAAMWMEDRVHSPRRLLAQMPLRPGLTVVDYACGPGRYTIPVAEAVGPAGRVYAVDSQPLALEILKRKAAHTHIANVVTVLVDSFNTGLPGGSADLVLLIDAITPITNRVPLLREIQRLLKPDGQLFMDASHMSAARAVSLVEETGLFEAVRLEGRVMLWRRAEGVKT